MSTSASPITFAIPFYEGIRYLPAALKSVLAQDDPNWRAIVCDDGRLSGVEDYVASFRANGRGESASADFRITVTTSTLWGIVGVGIIAVALLVLLGAVARFGRR